MDDHPAAILQVPLADPIGRLFLTMWPASIQNQKRFFRHSMILVGDHPQSKIELCRILMALMDYDNPRSSYVFMDYDNPEVVLGLG